jgi:alpha-galactosidase
LWLAPFIALPGPELAREHPELLLRDDRGEHVIAGHNWGTGYHALDLSRPAARDYLTELTRRVVHEIQ